MVDHAVVSKENMGKMKVKKYNTSTLLSSPFLHPIVESLPKMFINFASGGI